MDDESIIQLFWQRNQDAIRETDSLYGTKLHRLADGILRNKEDAEESVNDTYQKTWDSIPPQRPTYLFAYLAKICRFVCFGKLDWKNAQKRKAEVVELTAEMELCLPDTRADSQMAGEEIGRLLNGFISGLPEDKRLLFMRRYWYADSIRDISNRYGFSESKVKTTLHRTRMQLKAYLEREGIFI